MDEERLKERLRRHALEMVEKVSGQMPASLRRFREVERALKEETEALHAKCLQSWCDEAEDDSSKPLCPHCGGRMEQKERKEKHVICHGGDVVVERKRWWCERCGASFFPLDEEVTVGGLAISPEAGRTEVEEAGERP